MIPGIDIVIGGKSYVLPPLGLDGLEKTAQIWSDYDSMTSKEQLSGLIEMVHAALVRNYPELTLDEVRESMHAYEVTALQGAIPALFEERISKLRPASRQATKRK